MNNLICWVQGFVSIKGEWEAVPMANWVWPEKNVFKISINIMIHYDMSNKEVVYEVQRNRLYTVHTFMYKHTHFFFLENLWMAISVQNNFRYKVLA